MSIEFKILGKPGRDNSVFLWINSGKNYYRILLDCGENLLHKIEQSDLKNIDAILFSHLHIDHIAGFDYLFRRIFDRENSNQVFGPEDTIEIIHHRLNGFKWNLISELKGEWFIKEISEDEIAGVKIFANEGFKNIHKINEEKFDGIIFNNKDFKIKAAILNHKIPVLGFAISENKTFKVDKEKLEELNLPSGDWIQTLKNLNYNGKIKINEGEFDADELRAKLIFEKKTDKITYLTDFIFDETSKARSIKLAENSDVVICESQYLNEDRNLAETNFHLTSVQSAQIAKEANAKKLILFHISERYNYKDEIEKLLIEAREIFPETFFPDDWKY